MKLGAPDRARPLGRPTLRLAPPAAAAVRPGPGDDARAPSRGEPVRYRTADGAAHARSRRQPRARLPDHADGDGTYNDLEDPPMGNSPIRRHRHGSPGAGCGRSSPLPGRGPAKEARYLLELRPIYEA